MKAKPENFTAFEKWLVDRCHQDGVAMGKVIREQAAEIFTIFNQAKKGVLDRTCACGKPGFDVRNIQPAPTWPYEPHVLCERCLRVFDDYESLCSLILKEELRK